MKFKILIFSILTLGFFSCSDDDSCTDMDLEISHLESEYGCTNVGIELDNNFTIIRNQADYTTFVNADCQSPVDFAIYDLVIGKRGLSNGYSSIEYQLIKYCEKTNPALSVTFVLNDTDIAPNVTFNALVPKLEQDQSIDVELVFRN